MRQQVSRTGGFLGVFFGPRLFVWVCGAGSATGVILLRQVLNEEWVGAQFCAIKVGGKF